MNEEKDELMRIEYHIQFEDGPTLDFDVNLDNTTLELKQEPPVNLPDWTKLSHEQCPHCPLSTEKHPRCPIAVNLLKIIDTFKDTISYSKVKVEIVTKARTYKKDTAAQDVLSSLIGIYMVTSGCPVMDKLRPMVRMHLPFATMEETTYRAITMHLMAQYFLYKKGKEPDWDLKHLVKIYEDVAEVNKAFLKRIKGIAKQDAGLNAIFRLNCYAMFTNMFLQEGLGEIEKLFCVYLEGKDKDE